MSDEKRPPFRSWAEDYAEREQPLDRAAFMAAKRRRGFIARNAERENQIPRSGAMRQDVSAARLVMAGLEDQQRRASDPVERALTYLRGRGYRPVCKESTVGGKGKGYVVGRLRNVSPADAIAMAERFGFKVKE